MKVLHIGLDIFGDITSNIMFCLSDEHLRENPLPTSLKV